jgi:hypothetical protein
MARGFHSLFFESRPVFCNFAFSVDLALKLRKGEQNVQRQATKRRGCVELLRDRNEGRADA